MVFGIKKHILPILLFFLTLLIYLHNLSRSVYGGDVGDLVTAAIVGGVPHPSGYPLITFLGFLLTRIYFLTPAFMVGLISAFSSSMAVVLFYLFSFELTKNKLISLISSLALAFNYFFWFHAEIAEVFALNNFFVTLLMFLSFLYLKYKKIKYFYLLAFFTGLSLTNNYIISFIFPSLLILIGANYKEIIKKPKAILIGLVLGLLGLSVYLYIPIASFYNPPINWVPVKNLQTFFDVVLRKFYGTFGVGITPNLVLAQKLIIQKNYFFSLFYQLTFPVILICILGAVSLLKKNKLLFVVFVLGFVLSGPFFIALIGLPLQKTFFVGVYERFFTMSSVILLFFFPIGLQLIVNTLNKFFKKNTYQLLFTAVFLIIPILLFKYNFNKTDLHNVWVGDNLAYDLINPLPKNSFFLPNGDTSLFNTWYVHFGLKVRPDITLLSLVGLDSLKKETDIYLKKFPKDSKDPDLIAKTLLNLSGKYSVFSSVKVEPSKGVKLVWVPYGLVYKLENNKSKMLPEKDFVKLQSRIWSSFKNKDLNKIGNLGTNSLTISDISSAYSNALIAQGDYVFNNYHDLKLAQYYFQKAINIDSNNTDAYLVLGVLQMSNLNCKLARDNLDKSMDLDPLNNKTYYFSYMNYKFCFKDNTKAQDVVKNYGTVFKGDFFKDFKKEKAN